MRGILLLAAVVLILAFVGWITFSKGPDRASINIESDRIRQDTKEVMESGANLLHKAGDKVEAEASKQPTSTAQNPQAAPVPR